MIINAKEATDLYKKGIESRRNSDITKTQTIMKNIKIRAEKGFNWYEYQGFVTYAIAKTLVENGYILYDKKGSERNRLILKDFSNKEIYRVIVYWAETEQEE